MTSRLEQIRNHIAKIPFVRQIYHFEQRESYIFGKVQITFDGLDVPLDFDVEIGPQYPLKSYDAESINFVNKELVQYNHVMERGNICIHTSHATDIEAKLSIDFNSLKYWIEKYYINKDSDTNYEHIIVNEKPINGVFYSYTFTDCDEEFNKGEYGVVNLSKLNIGLYKEKEQRIDNFFVQEFVKIGGTKKGQQWGNVYTAKKHIHAGFYYFIETSPVNHNRFIFKNWNELADYLPISFLNYLHKFEDAHKTKNKGNVVPLFLGYKTVGDEIHWQVAHMILGEFPLEGVPEKIDGVKTGRWYSELADEEITWGLSRNASYKYFFGRGRFSDQLTQKKILIIGVGAIGSMLATTLARCGCQFIDFADYDIKEPENVCRSEYMFSNGITNKTSELKNILSDISPFVNIRPMNNNYFERVIKSFHEDDEAKKMVADRLANYDLIFDCSTDNDLMFVLNSLELTSEVINLSITNHAQEFVCAFYPNIYRFVNNQFSNVLKNNTTDLHNPTGCWSPTFKASYNDINVLIQLALKRINNLFHNGKAKNNFVIREDDINEGNFKIIEF